MHNTFLSNITMGCVNWNAVNQPCMNVDSVSFRQWKTVLITTGKNSWLTTNTTWHMRHHDIFYMRQNVFLRTWLTQFGGNHSNRSCVLPVFSVPVLSDLVCPPYHFQWRDIGMTSIYLTRLHNIYSKINYYIIPKFYTRWQQRSMETTTEKA